MADVTVRQQLLVFLSVSRESLSPGENADLFKNTHSTSGNVHGPINHACFRLKSADTGTEVAEFAAFMN
uniref:Peptidase_M16 domain-containing protein n=1 Tax=Mesocestoides corti TaxID=53468 RepID=A0A5K3FUL8_MESCO